MSATATTAAIFASSPAARNPSRLPTRKPRDPFFLRSFCASSRSSLFGRTFFITNRSINGSPRRSSLSTTGIKPFSPVMEWQDCTVKMEIDVPISVAYECYSDRESIPRWMPFISSVKILEDKPDLSRWTLKYKAFGQDIEYSWLARNMQPIPNQKIHWRSLEGLPNRGAVRFYPKGPSSCVVELMVSYEVPQLLVPVANALQPFLESLLRRGLERFARLAKSY
ncbi:Polyketide_cyc domain-containing protein [Psidium guajava]|nr:Polyketide_cyc domain-containing protein [Psidium guajava]